MVLMGGVGGRIGGLEEQGRCILAKPRGMTRQEESSYLPLGQWGTAKSFKMKNDNISERLIQHMHEE